MIIENKNITNQEVLSRLRWAARRGMLELDLILAPYVEYVYLNAPQPDKKAFHELLKCEDQDLFNWFIKSKLADVEHQNMVEKVLVVKKQTAQ